VLARARFCAISVVLRLHGHGGEDAFVKKAKIPLLQTTRVAFSCASGRELALLFSSLSSLQFSRCCIGFATRSSFSQGGIRAGSLGSSGETVKEAHRVFIGRLPFLIVALSRWDRQELSQLSSGRFAVAAAHEQGCWQLCSPNVLSSKHFDAVALSNWILQMRTAFVLAVWAALARQ